MDIRKIASRNTVHAEQESKLEAERVLAFTPYSSPDKAGSAGGVYGVLVRSPEVLWAWMKASTSVRVGASLWNGRDSANTSAL